MKSARAKTLRLPPIIFNDDGGLIQPDTFFKTTTALI